MAGESAHWAAISTDDAAILLRFVLERGTASATCHATKHGVAMKDIMILLSKGLDNLVQRLFVEEARTLLWV